MTRFDRLDPALLEGEGASPLMRAIWAKRSEEIESLLANGAEPNAR